MVLNLDSTFLLHIFFQKHISFLHGEFSRQISFPRKALDCDFSLYAGGSKGRVSKTVYFSHQWLPFLAFCKSEKFFKNYIYNLFTYLFIYLLFIEHSEAVFF